MEEGWGRSLPRPQPPNHAPPSRPSSLLRPAPGPGARSIAVPCWRQAPRVPSTTVRRPPHPTTPPPTPPHPPPARRTRTAWPVRVAAARQAAPALQPRRQGAARAAALTEEQRERPNAPIQHAYWIAVSPNPTRPFDRSLTGGPTAIWPRSRPSAPGGSAIGRRARKRARMAVWGGRAVLGPGRGGRGGRGRPSQSRIRVSLGYYYYHYHYYYYYYYHYCRAWKRRPGRAR